MAGYSKSKTSAKFQGTPKDVAKKMKKDPGFKKGMEKHYGVTVKGEKLISYKEGSQAAGKKYKQGK